MRGHFGELLMIELPRACWSTGLERLLARYRPAGVFFRGFETVPLATEAAAKSARTLTPVPFLAIEDQGSGVVCQSFTPLAGSTDLRSAEEAGGLIGSAIQLVGLNFDLAPVLDLTAFAAGGPAEPPGSGDRTGPPLAACVAGWAEAFIKGLARWGILACGRHFPAVPAYASAKSSGSAAHAPVVAKTMMTLWQEDLVPYRKLGAKLAMVEVTSAICKAYDYEFPRPASLSTNVVDGLLRVKLGYPGVAMADAEAAAAAAGVDAGEAAIRAIAAGCDLIRVPGEGDRLELVATSLSRAFDLGRLAAGRAELALERVRAARQRLRRPGKAPSARELERLAVKFAEFKRKHGAGERDVA